MILPRVSSFLARFTGRVGVAGAILCLSLTSAPAVTIDWATVGDPGNAADTAWLPGRAGAVADVFQIMKYEFTNSQYASFLNAVAVTDAFSLYNPGMAGDTNHGGGGIVQVGSSGSFSYTVKPLMGDKPVNYVSWFDAARVANWLHNGQGSASTETGAYTLAGATTGTPPSKNPGARFFIPADDEWYKAAYYKGGGTASGYWPYATQSDTAPTPVTANADGDGSAGSTGTFANYLSTADWGGQDGNVTTVGTNGGPSAYGAFDMSGNLYEWTDLQSVSYPPSARPIRGGFWNDKAPQLRSDYRLNFTASSDLYWVGFRLAGPVGGPSVVPEIDAVGWRPAIALIMACVSLLERRRTGR